MTQEVNTNIQNLWDAANEAVYILGGKNETRSAVAAQFIQEKGWEWFLEPAAPFNIGNTTNGGVENGFAEFATLQEGIEGYCHVLLETSFDNGVTKVYQNVIDEIRGGTAESVLEALCNSPYCVPAYPLAPLQDIMAIVDELYAEHLGANPPTLDTGEVYVEVTARPPHNTLWGIATDTEGQGRLWTNFIPLNPGLDARRLQVGQKIRVK